MHFQPLSANHKNPSLLPPLPFMRHFEWKLGTIFVHDWIISHFLLCDSMGIIFAPGQNWAAVSMALPYPIWAMFLLPSIHPRTKLFDPLWCVNEPWLDFPLHFLWNHPFASLTFFHPPHAAVLKAWIEQTGTTTKWATFFVPWSDLSKMEISWKAIFLLFNTCWKSLLRKLKASQNSLEKQLSLDITIVERSKLE